ncbi:MAG: excinuclease ABC subunit UvrB [Phycisphaeraceae bacterium]|nr:excinuclease ABC subunit UvrB [Phycisphaeraceae bacterium]
MSTTPASFEVVSRFQPTGDQPEAIRVLVDRFRRGDRHAVLLGATGTGKTFTMANVIAAIGEPTLIISHNKTLAAQLYEELREFFPNNSVNYFVSYYDYYQPEAYIPARDIYIEKDSSRNDDLDQLRLAATSNLLSRRDTIVVASVSCIFGLGSPEAYGEGRLPIVRGTEINRRDFFLSLSAMQYQRTEIEFTRGTFRVRGDAIEIWPAYERFAVRVELFGNEVDRIELINPTSGELLAEERQFHLFPAVHYVMPEERLKHALSMIREELDQRVAMLRSEGKLLEAQRLMARTRYDLEIMEETGSCPGVENYSRFFDGRSPGDPPFTLLDYFERGCDERDGEEEGGIVPVARSRARGDWLIIVDESHVTIPQIRAMFNGDQARKRVLVEHGFRLPSALDNRPLRFEEYERAVPRALYVSATPGPYELELVGGEVAEQVIRPTGLLDPEVVVRPADGQVPDLLEACRERVARGERVLVTALTKRLCEDLTGYLDEQGLKVRYLHSDIDTLERIAILTDLRMGEFDVLVGVNLLREGLDLPEVSLVCVLDADKEGFLRSPTSLIQTMGRAARNENALVILYADKVTPAMRAAIEETERRRAKQMAHNAAHGITPKTISKPVRRGIETELRARKVAREALESAEEAYEAGELMRTLEEEMLREAKELNFERAAALRDQASGLKRLIEEAGERAMVTRSQLDEILSGRGQRRAGMPGVKASKRRKVGKKR